MQVSKLQNQGLSKPKVERAVPLCEQSFRTCHACTRLQLQLQLAIEFEVIEFEMPPHWPGQAGHAGNASYRIGRGDDHTKARSHMKPV